jgi:hypothetical protein
MRRRHQDVTSIAASGQSLHFDPVPLTTGLPRSRTLSDLPGWSGSCHVWTAPGWQELFSRFAALVGAAMCSTF